MAEPLRYDMTLPNGQPLRWNTPGARWNGTVEEVMAALNPPNTMAQNKISAVLAAQAITNITTAVATLRTNLPFLIALTKEERRNLPHAGSNTQGVIQEALIFAAQHPEAFPATFSTTEFQKDGALLAALVPVMASIAQLNEDVSDTLLALNSDLYLAFLDVYAFAKANNRGGAYDAFLDAVKGRFARSGKAKPATPTP